MPPTLQVIVEASPTSTWSIFRDYTAEGNVRSDRYIDGSQVDYQYASGGRLLRTRLPWGGYRMRNDYDSNPGDPELPTMVSGIVMENNAGSAVFTWARNMTHDGLGRLASAYLADNSSSTTPSIGIARGTNGRMSSMQIYSGAGIGGPSGNIADYNYAYHSDLMLKSITNSGGAGRFFYYDGANRLTCDATTGTACPANGNPALVAAYGYDTADNRTSSASSASATSTTYTYPNPGATVAPELTSVSLPGGRTVAYSYYADGTRYLDNETTSGVATNTRNLYYDGVGRLNSLRISDAVAGAAAGTIQTHVINVWYDAWSRPVLVNNLNTTTNVNESYRYYWGFDNRLLAIKRTPNTAVGANFDVDEYVEIGPVVGVQRLHYVNSTLSTTSRWYTARSHNGQPIASWSATSPYAETWRATRTSAFGEVLAETGDPTKRGPWGFLGHIQLPDSSVEVWNGSALTQLRPSLYMTNWRAYDPMLGAWTAPEPARWEGWLPFAPAYGYANQSPMAYADANGRNPFLLLVLAYFVFVADSHSGDLAPDAQVNDLADLIQGPHSDRGSGPWRNTSFDSAPDRHRNRNANQLCPDTSDGLDRSPDWRRDNGRRHDASTFRGTSEENRGFQCSYDGCGRLSRDPVLQGSFDYTPPNELSDIPGHIADDVYPAYQYGTGPSAPDARSF